MSPALFIGRARAAALSLFAIAAAFVVSTPQAAATDVHASINGQDTVIGDLAASNGYFKNDPNTGQLLETGSFTLGMNYRYLMDDAHPCQFRWFQIVTTDASPPNYLGTPPTVPYTDPPSGGWDYERTPKDNFLTGKPGADDAPFYEDNPGFGGTFDYNNFHSAANGTSRTEDRPGLPNGSLQFQTYLVFVNPELAADHEFIPLIGYSWGGTGNAAGKGTSFNGPTLILSANFDFALMQDALNSDGFALWSPTRGDLECVPDSGGTLLLFGISVIFVLSGVRHSMSIGRQLTRSHPQAIRSV